ncbi:MAG: DUF421 domain-containing protein [Williamsia sp.]|nr:DUF421 domain-containing protein [Williamsia sp.]
MRPEEIKLSDVQRILFGQVPPEFYIELVIRGLLSYLLLIVAMRLLGSRMSGHISRLEMAALVSLSSAIGVPLLSPMNGILPAFIIAMIIVVISRIIARLSIKSKKVEDVTQGEFDTLIEDGIMDLDTMKKCSITRERLFSELRSLQVSHLGHVKRLYMEAGGAFTFVPNEQAFPGLLVLPGWDKDFLDDQIEWTNTTICKECGERKMQSIVISDDQVTCTNCGAREWTRSVVDKEVKKQAS